MNHIVQETIDRCRAAGLCGTKAVEELVSTLLESQRPKSLAELAGSKRQSSACSPSTVWSAASACTSARRIPRCSLR